MQVAIEALIVIVCNLRGNSGLFRHRKTVCFQFSKHVVVYPCLRDYHGIFIKDVFPKLW